MLNPEDEFSLNFLCKLYRDSGDHLAAELTAMECINLSPEYSCGYVNLALAQKFLGKYTEAKATLEIAERFAQDDNGRQQAKDLRRECEMTIKSQSHTATTKKAAKCQTNRMSRSEEKQVALLLLKVANRLREETKYEAAMHLYNIVLKLDTSEQVMFIERSFCHLKMRQFAEALKDANEAIRFTPKAVDSNILILVGNIFLQQGQIEDALVKFRQALIFENDRQFRPMEDFDSPLWIRVSVKLQSVLDTTTSSSSKKLSDAEIQSSLRMHTDSIAQNPADWSAWCKRSFLYSTLSKHKEALDDALEATRLNPKIYDSHARLTSAYIRLGRFKEAQEEQTRACEFLYA